MNILSFAEAQRPLPATVIEGTKLLIGEGSHEASFFKALLAHMSIENIQVGHYGGKDRLRGFLKALRNIPGFRDLAQIGVTRDADDSHDAAFDSVCSALENEDFVPPDRPGEFSAGPIRAGAFILPDNASPGMMETLCLQSVENDPVLECVDAFLDCIR